MKSILAIRKTQLVCLALLASLACSPHIYKVPDEALEFPSVSVYEVTVDLQLTAELLATAARFVWQGEIFITELGEPLAANSTRMARALFERVTVCSTGDCGSEPRSEAVLTPRVVSIQQSIPSSAWDQSTISMALEWSLTTPEGKIVWVETVVANGTAAGGGGFGRGATSRTRGSRLLADAFEKSFYVISRSSEIARYVDSVRKGSSSEPQEAAVR